MDESLQTNQENLESSPRYIEIEVPNDASIFFYKAALRSGLETLEQGKKLLLLAGDEAAASRIHNAIVALTAFVDIVREVEADIIKEFQEKQRVGVPEEVEVGFATHIEGDDKELLK
jgi:hypothetical protein